jgi:uncharacterized protein (DUF4415 family)
MKRKRGSSTIRRVTSGKQVREGKTDWERLRTQRESDIRFTEDAPRTTPEDWFGAIAHKGLPLPARKKQIALRIDEDVLEWFKSLGPGYQTRMNAVLREFRNAHRAASQGTR